MALIITIKVVPQAGRVEWTRDAQGVIKCYLLSAAINNRANEELIKLLSKILKYHQNTFMIVQGATAKIKKIKIDAPITQEEFEQKIGLEKQHVII